MRQTIIYIFLIFLLGCNNQEEEKHSAIGNKADSTKKKEYRQTLVQPDSILISPKKDIVDFTKTVQVKVKMNEIEFLDSVFFKQIDSLIKFEKKCMNSTLKGLHWVFNDIGEKTYELTASSDFAGTYHGYVVIDNSIVFLGPKELRLYRKTERNRMFIFANKKFPFPEDYSVWLFKFDGERIKLVKSYTFPCD